MINKVKEYVKNILDDESTGHDYMHALRVLKNSELMISDEMNTEIVFVSALTHDLIDKKVSSDPEKSWVALETELAKYYSSQFIKEVKEVINNISYSKGSVPSSLEGRIVQDADRLDSLGAIGIARTFAYGGKNNRNIYHPDRTDDSVTHFYDKLFKLTELMNTDIGKEIAIERTKYMKEFIERLYKEIK